MRCAMNISFFSFISYSKWPFAVRVQIVDFFLNVVEMAILSKIIDIFSIFETLVKFQFLFLVLSIFFLYLFGVNST